MNRLKYLLFTILFICQIGFAEEINVNSAFKIPQGKGLVVFTLNAPSEFGFEQLNAFNIFWRPVGNRKYERSVGVGKKYPPDLREKYKLNTPGRLIFLELEPGEYLFDSVGLDTPSNSLSILSLADRRSHKNTASRFTVVDQKINYLGHIEISPFQSVSKTGSIVASFLITGKNLTDFSAILLVTDQSLDLANIIKTIAPQLEASLEKTLVRSVLYSDLVHPENLYPSTTYAKLNDVNALPSHVKSGCVDLYQKFLERKHPKAFVIASTGQCNYSNSASTDVLGESPIPAIRALSNCSKRNNKCALYAIDDRIVYQP